MITTCVPVSAKADFLRGLHTEDDRYMVALYGPSADLGKHTTVYTKEGEARGKGYRPGGYPLGGCRVWVDGDAACLTFDEGLLIPTTSISVRGYVVYNASKGNRVIFVADFGGDYTSTEGPFKLPIAADMVAFE